MAKHGRRHSKEFKLEAVRLLNEANRPVSVIAYELGIKRTLLYRWRDELKTKGDMAFNGKPGRPKNTELSELARLKKELKEVTEERDILKKAGAYFTKMGLK